MEHIKDILGKVAAELSEPPTSDESGSTTVLEKCEAFLTLRDEHLERMRFAAEQFVADMLAHKPPRWISFLGSSGAGKTMLARWINSMFKRHLDWQIDWPKTERTKTALNPFGEIIRDRGDYVSWARIARLLRDGEYRVLDDLCVLSFLVLDDIGAEYGTPFIDAKLYELLSRRERKWTVITGNLSLSDIEQRIDARISSRMIRHGSVVIDVDVPDFNLRDRSAFQQVREEMGR